MMDCRPVTPDAAAAVEAIREALYSRKGEVRPCFSSETANRIVEASNFVLRRDREAQQALADMADLQDAVRQYLQAAAKSRALKDLASYYEEQRAYARMKALLPKEA